MNDRKRGRILIVDDEEKNLKLMGNHTARLRLFL